MSIHSKLVMFGAVLLALSACQTAPDRERVPEERLFEVVPIEFAEARVIAHSLNGIFKGSTVRAHAYERTNTVLLAGSPAEMARAMTMVAQLDIEVGSGEEQTTIEVITLHNADADAVRDSLSGLLERRSSQFEIDRRTNALLVRADPESMARIKELVVQLDREK